MRDLPVLTRIIERLDEAMGTEYPQVRDIAEDLGMANGDVGRAVPALGDEFIELQLVMSGGDPGPWSIVSVTPAARRVVGQWPKPRLAIWYELSRQKSWQRSSWEKFICEQVDAAADIVRDIAGGTRRRQTETPTERSR